MKAREWLERGAGKQDSFDALSDYWRGFNNLFAGKGQERDLISNFLRMRVDKHLAQSLIEDHAKEVQLLVSQPIVDMRGNGRDTSQFIEQFGVAVTAIDKLVAIFMVIYQIRCNFEHGQKSPSRKRDRALCNAACPFVAAVVRHAA